MVRMARSGMRGPRYDIRSSRQTKRRRRRRESALVPCCGRMIGSASIPDTVESRCHGLSLHSRFPANRPCRRAGRQHGRAAGGAGTRGSFLPRHRGRTRPGAGGAGTPQGCAAGPAHPRSAEFGRICPRALLSGVLGGSRRGRCGDLRLRARCTLVPSRRVEGPAACGRPVAGAEPAISRVAREAKARGAPQRRLRPG